MAESVTDAELTLLGLLAEGPRHGYELASVIEERGVRNWTALGFSSIYYLLGRLAKRGLVETTGEQVSPTARNPYRLTVRGHEVCAEASLEALCDVTPVHARVLIGMANSPWLGGDEVRESLSCRIAALQDRLDAVCAARERQEPLPRVAAAIFDYGEAMLRADLDWTRSQLQEETP